MQDLKQYNVTVQVFNPEASSEPKQEYVLPVDSPDEEHAISAAMSNAVAFTTKVEGSTVKPIAFRCLTVALRS